MKKNNNPLQDKLINLQVQYFKSSDRLKLKNWAHNNNLEVDSMRSLLVKLIENKDLIEKALGGK